MGGKIPKKRKAVRQAAYEKEGKRMRLRHDHNTRAANEWFNIPEMIVEQLLFHCDLITVLTLAKTNQYARDLVKSFFMCNIRLLVIDFFTAEFLDGFYLVLENSLSAIAGSVVSSVLSFPYQHKWKPANLNISVPRGHMFMWFDFLDSIGLSVAEDSGGVSRKHRRTTLSHVIYTSKKPGFNIHLSESCDGSVLTPLLSSTTTFCTNIATCSDIYSLYTNLTVTNTAVDGWFPTPVRQAMTIYRRGIDSSISTSGWDGPCGWACPILWRHLRGLKGVGVFRWGGNRNQHADGISTVGIPMTDTDFKWRLGDWCRNHHCPWSRANYLNFRYRTF